MRQGDGGTVTVNKRTVGFLGLLAVVPAIWMLAEGYVGFHEAVAEQVAKSVMDAKIEQIELKIDTAQKTANESAGKLDVVAKQISSLVVDSAISTVAALKTLRDEHMANQNDSIQWRREKQRLDTAIEKATLRRDCLIENRDNCDLLH